MSYVNFRRLKKKWDISKTAATKMNTIPKPLTWQHFVNEHIVLVQTMNIVKTILSLSLIAFDVVEADEYPFFLICMRTGFQFGVVVLWFT